MAARNAPLSISGPTDFAEAFKVPRETIHRLTRYAELLAHWQKRTNLVAPSTFPTLSSPHFADSAQLTTLAPKARLWLDLGTGAGFPVLVIAILKAGTPDFRMHLVESNRKKCAFLAEVARATKAPVDIHAMRIEELAESAESLRPDVVSARALAPLPRLLNLASALFGTRTRGLCSNARDPEPEKTGARTRFDFGCRIHASLTADGWIVEISDLRRKETGRAP